MKKNKMAALALVSVMLCGSLAGCGNTGNVGKTGNTGEAPESATTKNAETSTSNSLPARSKQLM